MNKGNGKTNDAPKAGLQLSITYCLESNIATMTVSDYVVLCRRIKRNSRKQVFAEVAGTSLSSALTVAGGPNKWSEDHGLR